jgi:hypothetical protein
MVLSRKNTFTKRPFKGFDLALMQVQTKSHDEEKLPTVHFELISPPPKV